METDDGSASYVKLPIRRFPPRAERETSEGRYWRAYRQPLVSAHAAGVTFIHHMEVMGGDCETRNPFFLWAEMRCTPPPRRCWRL